MIGYIKGIFTYKSPAMVHIEAYGIGYEINISLHTYDIINSLTEGTLFTYLQIKEDAHTLYGFAELKEKEIFMQLISVSGIGATSARMMLSSLKVEEIAAAITQNNVKLLESVKGIGKKTAERLVLELKDKIGKTSLVGLPFSGNNGQISPQYDAIQALISLGIAKAVAENAVKKAMLENITELQLIIKKSLQLI